MEALLTTTGNTLTSLFTLVIDSGATHHMFKNRSLFTSFTERSENISTSDPSSNLICKGHGTVKIIINNKSFTLLNCLFVPKLTKNLNNQTFLSGQLINKLMVVFFNQPTANLTKSSPNPPWHLCLGHPRNQVLKSLGLQPIDDNSCNSCAKGKMTALPLKGHFVEVTKPLDCLHLDIVGPIPPPSTSGHRYFLTIVDQYTSYKIIRFLKNKSEVFDEFVSQKTLIENTQDRKVKRILTNGGGEFVNHQFRSLASQSGFIHSVSPLYTPENNGFAEHAN
ncbi:hypothetical protein O181_103953 [Austropuccinia psidii MF-1]|uniref:Integrase catalytic domain-containing protein n=1 Tax=Austropuccinia psidii MF-1 TaxID=1389203 RepID=A0A9Q3JLB0_9BASI|nr:hypothetical protein [Austropuccinia psidii MF-1]